MGTGSALHVISEPEAAAMYALDAMAPHNIKVGDTFVLCGAGGGTVDLISYKVSALKPTLSIEEAAPGSGSLCGSTFLNRIFHKFLTDRFSNDPDFDEDVVEEAMKRFEVTVQFLERSSHFFIRSSALSAETQQSTFTSQVRVSSSLCIECSVTTRVLQCPG